VEREKRHVTKVLLQVGRDVGTIGCKSLSAAVSAGRIKPSRKSYLQLLKQNQAAVPGWTL